MKLLLLLSVLALISSSEQVAKFYNCPESVTNDPSYKDTCISVSCDGPNRRSAIACAVYVCSPEKPQIGEREVDMTKEYPKCCGGPICQD